MALFKRKKSDEEKALQSETLHIVSKEEIKAREKELRAKNGDEIPTDLAYVSLRNIDKVYDNGVQAVYDFTLDVTKHEFIVFVGPSGCGKSTTLRMIAGLEDITNGDLYIDGEYANDKSPKDRDIAMVFQSYALYPHMSVYDNMAFGLKIRRLPKAEIDRRVHDAAKILQIEEYLDRKPKALSGGQRQRVALGRAIVRNAKVFLMDEPLSNLDAKLRVQMRSEIIKLHEALGATTIYVTHDQTEAMTMATRIVVMKLGYIQQIGTPLEIYNHPANIFVASFIGSPAMNLLKGKFEKGNVLLASGEKIALSKEAVAAYKSFYEKRLASLKCEKEQLFQEINALESEEGKDNKTKENKLASLKKKEEKITLSISKAETALKGEGELIYGIRPEDIHEGNEENQKKYQSLPYGIRVSVAELLGHEYYVHTDFGATDLVAKIPMNREIKNGEEMKILFDLSKAHIFDPDSESLIY